MDAKKIMKGSMVLIGAIVLVLSAILCVHAFSGHGLIGCSAGSSCNQVLGSRWSFVMGLVPVSGLAVIAYIVFLVTLLSVDSFKDDPAFESLLWKGIIVVCGAIMGSAVWFIWLQKNMIRAFCPYCMSAHLLGVVTTLLTLTYVIKFGIMKKWWHAALCFAAGILLAGGLAAFQLATTPRTAYERGFIPEELPLRDADELPSVGDPAAQKVVTLLFDYQCSHCQRVHSMLPQLVENLGGEVVFVTCPTPLSSACNPYVPSGEDRFAGSCDLMRIALATWLVDRSAFSVLDEWLFTPGERGWYPRKVADAMEYAASLIGEDALKKSMTDPWINDYLADILEVFGRTSTDSMAAIPRFICGNSWVVPDADDVDGLTQIIRQLTE
ncbi:MAG: thioredoxin domain-containing protein [Bacteroidales bacterium]|nr:thioredoxin domain-containing protein [Bacteroidales bacterium]